MLGASACFIGAAALSTSLGTLPRTVLRLKADPCGPSRSEDLEGIRLWIWQDVVRVFWAYVECFYYLLVCNFYVNARSAVFQEHFPGDVAQQFAEAQSLVEPSRRSVVGSAVPL